MAEVCILWKMERMADHEWVFSLTAANPFVIAREHDLGLLHSEVKARRGRLTAEREVTQAPNAIDPRSVNFGEQGP